MKRAVRLSDLERAQPVDPAHRALPEAANAPVVTATPAAHGGDDGRVGGLGQRKVRGIDQLRALQVGQSYGSLHR